MDWPRYSGGAYAALQRKAEAQKIGIWAGPFQPPWEWRAAQRQQQSRQTSTPFAPLVGVAAPGDCRIKGNIGNKGQRIYHVPGQRHYDETRISESKGERWFCSEREARAAGWRTASE